MGSTIQFKSKESVCRAFESRGVDLWGLFQGKQFLFKGEGLGELESVLNAISEGGTNAIYTLRVYEGIEGVEKIKNRTEDDGSFNFRLNEPEQGLPNSTLTSYAMMSERLKSIEDKLQDKDDFEDIEITEQKSLVGEIMGNPAIAALIPVLLEKVIAYLSKSPDHTQKSNLIIPGNVPKDSQRAVMNGIPIVDRLREYDPEIEKHLEKLLEIAKQNKTFFDLLIEQLNSLK